MSLGISAAAWAGIGAIGSIGLGVYGASQAGDASDAQQAGNREALLLQQQNRDIGLNLAEPNRYLGYQALGDLSSLYGYQQAPYQTANQLIGSSGGGVGSGPIAVDGRKPNHSEINRYVGGMDEGKYGGSIDPRTGTVVVNGNPELSAKYTEYLRTGNLDAIGGRATKKNERAWRIFSNIESLRSSGWKYDPAAIEQAENYSPVGQPTSGKTSPPGTTGVGGYDKSPEGTSPGGTSADGTAGNMSRFFTSPDYTFRRDEGAKAIDRGAAARSGAVSGNAIRANTEYAGNLASGEYSNYVNRLMQMAGMGTAANNTAAQTVNNYAANAGNLAQQQGDARASGIMGQYGALVGGFNGASNIMGNYFGGLNRPVGG